MYVLQILWFFPPISMVSCGLLVIYMILKEYLVSLSMNDILVPNAHRLRNLRKKKKLERNINRKMFVFHGKAKCSNYYVRKSKNTSSQGFKIFCIVVTNVLNFKLIRYISNFIYNISIFFQSSFHFEYQILY